MPIHSEMWPLSSATSALPDLLRLNNQQGTLPQNGRLAAIFTLTPRNYLIQCCVSASRCSRNDSRVSQWVSLSIFSTFFESTARCSHCFDHSKHFFSIGCVLATLSRGMISARDLVTGPSSAINLWKKGIYIHFSNFFFASKASRFPFFAALVSTFHYRSTDRLFDRQW